MTRSELAGIMAALARVDALLDRALLLVHAHHPLLPDRHASSQATEALNAFWHGLRPDPWPEAPTWMNQEQATAWSLGFNAGRQEGRRLEAAERGCGGAGDG
jgi:hypothetical protein